MIHGPSLTIGAAIASVAIVIVFFAFESFSEDKELELERTPPRPLPSQEMGPPAVTMETFLENGSPTLGDPAAPVILVEFGDYQCHFCNVFFHSTEEKIVKNYVETGKVRMIFKDFNIIGPDSVNASHGAHCASDQGMFWEYHDVLYSNWTGENNGWAAPENLTKYAQGIGLDMETWSECMAQGTHAQVILASNDDARDLALTGTPAFFVIGPDGNVTNLFGAQPYESFRNIFEIELKK